MGLPGSDYCHPHPIRWRTRLRYFSTIFGKRVLFYQKETRLRGALKPFLGSVGVITHGKSPPSNDAQSSAVVSSVPLPSIRKGVSAAVTAMTIWPWMRGVASRSLVSRSMVRSSSVATPTCLRRTGIVRRIVDFVTDLALLALLTDSRTSGDPTIARLSYIFWKKADVTRPRKELSLIFQEHHSPWVKELFDRSQN